MQTTAQDLIERAAKYDPSLAADIRAFAKAREFGLVFEHNRPEAMRLYGKKISKGDTVHILAPRGKVEKPENKVPWRVAKIAGETAHLERAEGTGTSCDVNLCDLVAVAAFEEPIYAGLREVGRVERGGDRPYQVVINGENYHTLEALTFACSGRVDCIYIDPPYNSGARNWKYNNDYVDASDEYRHSKWLAFMERRLRLARKLMNPECSALIVTIDEKEYLRLGILLQQIFPGERIQMVSTVINPAGAGRTTELARTDEYIFYVQMGSSAILPEDRNLENVPVVWDTLRRSSLAGGARDTRPNQFYPIYVNNATGRIDSIGEPIPNGIPKESAPQIAGCTAVFPIRPDGTEMNWGVLADEARRRLEAGYLRAGKHEPNKPQKYVISYLTGGVIEDIESGKAVLTGRSEDGTVIAHYPTGRVKMPTTNWNRPSHDAQRYGTNILKSVIPNRSFPFPKSLYAVEDALRIIVGENKDALIIDFFSGSGTTAHAVMRLNHQDGGNRRCVCVTNNEVSEAEAKKMTKQELRQGDFEWERYGIFEYITKPRIQAAITGLTPEGELIKGEYASDDSDTRSSKRKITMIDYLDLEIMRSHEKKAVAGKKKVLSLLSKGTLPQKLLDENSDYAITESSEYAILFNDAEAERWVEQLEGQDQIRALYIITDNNGLFRRLKKEIEELLGEYKEEVPVSFPMADGFEENAIFFDLTYQNPVVIDLDGAFEEVAPLLWMRAGCKGPIIATRGDGTYELSETYAILFDYAFAQDFIMELDARPEIQTVYVVTDDEGRYQSINQALKGRDVVQLYESYLRSFQIAAEGALI